MVPTLETIRRMVVPSCQISRGTVPTAAEAAPPRQQKASASAGLVASTAPAPPTRPVWPWQRAVICGLVFIFCTGFSVAAFRWIKYRWNYVVCHDATIKGPIAHLGVRIAGRIKSLDVEEGQRVLQGDVIGRLDDRHLNARVAQAASQLELAKEALEIEKLAIAQERARLTQVVSRAKLDVRTSEVQLQYEQLMIAHQRRCLALEVSRAKVAPQIASAELEGAKSELKRWQKEFARISSLASREVITTSELDEVRAALETASASTTAALARQRGAEVDYRGAEVQLQGVQVWEAGLKLIETQVEVARAALAAAELELEGLHVREAGLDLLEAQAAAACSAVAAAEADLEDTVIRAPEDGWVIRCVVQPGASVDVGDPIVSLWTGDRLWVEAWVKERDLDHVGIGVPTDIVLTAYPDWVLPGRIDSIGVLTDNALLDHRTEPVPEARPRESVKVNVHIALLGEHPKLIPGLSVLVGIPKGQALIPGTDYPASSDRSSGLAQRRPDAASRSRDSADAPAMVRAH